MQKNIYGSKRHKRYIIAMFCVVWYAIFFVTQQRTSRQKTDNFFIDKEQDIENIDISATQKQYIAIHNALQQNDIQTAIQNIPNNTAKDLYNRGTLKTIRAYQQLSSWDSSSYEKILMEASDDFDRAQKLTNNPKLQQRIQYNKNISKNIDSLWVLYSCFDDFSTLIQQLTNITNTTQMIMQTIADQLNYIAANENELSSIIDEQCINNINTTFAKTYQSLENTQTAITKNIPIYTQTLWEYTQDPSLCFGTNIKPLTQDANDTQSQLNKLAQTYSITQAALETRNSDILNQMCEQSQDDTLSDQETQNTLQDLIQNLEQSIKQAQNKPEQEQQDFQSWTTSWTPQYIPLTNEEQETLEEIDKYNKEWIQNMTQIRQQWYTPSKILETLFDVFYGDTSEFTIPWR